MKKFIEIRRKISGFVMHDILSIDRIDNVYIDQPEKRAVVIVRDDGIRYKETYSTGIACEIRFRILVRILDAYTTELAVFSQLVDDDPNFQEGEEINAEQTD